MLYVRDWRKNTGMKRYSIEITDLAEEDLEGLADYIAYVLLNPDAAKNIVRGIKYKISSLCVMPESHSLDEDKGLAALGIRKIYYENYKIYYIVDNQKGVVVVLCILHMLMNSRDCLYQTLELN